MAPPHALRSSPTPAPPASAQLKAQQVCLRSCRGLTLFLAAQQGASEPACLGLSTLRQGPVTELQKMEEVRDAGVGEPGRSVSLAISLGHSVWQSGSHGQGAPGCKRGVELVRFNRLPAEAEAAALSSSSLPKAPSSRPDSHAAAPSPAASALPVPAALASFASSLSSFVCDFRLLTSSASANARIQKTLGALTSFDADKFAAKFQSQAGKNMDGMSKWLRDLQDAVSKPPKA
ncbi:hypothetical protein TSOC_014097 [Tetrabaena socialis]|uniref:Uncharacterized protein n=1 Tax=Tetrabaena socialis TaxID=47790 RepID=A0A2J7ZIK0_9CHLO|nr:hypothetical protein TSOC_014097 [Tetrabaena socialis]|eukprot:PNH00097.1 hypothetical protein TSOC_014097 [Tetrabaena socialis]